MRILTIKTTHLESIVWIMFFRKRGETTLEPPDALRASQELVAARSVKHVLEIALNHAMQLAPAASKGWAVIRTFDGDKIAAVKGYGFELIDQNLVGPWHDGVPRISTNLTGDLFQPNLPEVRAKLAAVGMREVKTAIIIPLRDRSDLRGALILDSYGPEAFQAGALESVARWAQMVTPALELIRELGRYRTLSWGLTLAFVEAIEAQDFAQLGHAQRVTSYALALARELRLTTPEQNDLWFAAMLHDLGKLSVPDSSDPGEHAGAGYNMLGNVPELHRAREAILHHHENYDGSGVPNSLQSTEIPVFSRIIAVANTYDRLTSERGEMLNAREALSRMRAMAGRELDPELIPILESVLNQNKATGELRPEGLFPA
jgi:HD-GYP domain-containing protein (c-di-GMP phosphodiesterase class II)